MLIKKPRPWRYWKVEQYNTKVVIPCYYCNVFLSKQEATVDHVVPKSLGGLNHPSNYVISCKPCNDNKGNNIYEI